MMGGSGREHATLSAIARCWAAVDLGYPWQLVDQYDPKDFPETEEERSRVDQRSLGWLDVLSAAVWHNKLGDLLYEFEAEGTFREVERETKVWRERPDGPDTITADRDRDIVDRSWLYERLQCWCEIPAGMTFDDLALLRLRDLDEAARTWIGRVVVTRDNFLQWCADTETKPPAFWTTTNSPPKEAQRCESGGRPKRRGRKPGDGTIDDSNVITEMRNLVASGDARGGSEAASMLAHKARGSANEQSKRARLYRKYHKEFESN